MERDFMGLNSKDSVFVVKEEALEDFKDSVEYAKGYGLPWLLPATVSTLPHLMAFKASLDEKMSNVMADNLASSGFIPESAADAFDVNIKLQPGELHNFAGATPKQQFLGGVPVAFPHSVLPSSGFVAGTTESWLDTNASRPPTQMTIFYAGAVNVFEAITPEKAQAIMLLAGYGCLSPNMSQTRLQVQVPPANPVAADAAYCNQTRPPTSALSSSLSVSSRPVGPMSGGALYGDEPMVPQNAGISIQTEPLDMMASITAVAASSAIPQFRKASLARFLEKRKERVMNSSPYNLSKKSPTHGLSAASVAPSIELP